jgi:hypothetical protein
VGLAPVYSFVRRIGFASFPPQARPRLYLQCNARLRAVAAFDQIEDPDPRSLDGRSGIWARDHGLAVRLRGSIRCDQASDHERIECRQRPREARSRSVICVHISTGVSNQDDAAVTAVSPHSDLFSRLGDISPRREKGEQSLRRHRAAI